MSVRILTYDEIISLAGDEKILRGPLVVERCVTWNHRFTNIWVSDSEYPREELIDHMKVVSGKPELRMTVDIEKELGM